MAYQTPFRAHLRVFEQQGDIIKFHPFVDIDEGEFLFYLDKYQLPRHPLEKHGYGSIGCVHCTAKGKGRAYSILKLFISFNNCRIAALFKPL